MTKIAHILTLIILLIIPVAVFGQEPPAVPPELGFLDRALEFLKGLEADGIIVGLAVVVELLFRFIKTEKPKSIAYLISDGVKMLGDILHKLGELLDKILPQRVS